MTAPEELQIGGRTFYLNVEGAWATGVYIPDGFSTWVAPPEVRPDGALLAADSYGSAVVVVSPSGDVAQVPVGDMINTAASDGNGVWYVRTNYADTVLIDRVDTFAMTHTPEWAELRLTATGAVELTFDASGLYVLARFAGFHADSGAGRLLRLDSTGTVDPAFAPALENIYAVTGQNISLSKVAVADTGVLLAAQRFPSRIWVDGVDVASAEDGGLFEITFDGEWGGFTTPRMSVVDTPREVANPGGGTYVVTSQMGSTLTVVVSSPEVDGGAPTTTDIPGATGHDPIVANGLRYLGDGFFLDPRGYAFQHTTEGLAQHGQITGVENDDKVAVSTGDYAYLIRDELVYQYRAQATPVPPPPGFGILFEPIPPETFDGGGTRPLSMAAQGLGYALLVGDGFGSRPLTLRSFGEAYDFVQDFEPSIPATGFLPLALSPYAEGYSKTGGSGARPLHIEPRAMFSAAGGGAPPLTITTSGYDSAPVFAHAFLEDRMPEMGAYGGTWFTETGVDLLLGDGSFADYAVAVNEVLRLADAPMILASFLRTVQASITLRDFVTAVFEREVLADLTLEDHFEALLEMVVLVTDRLLLEDEGLSLLSTLHTVVGALALRDAVRLVLQGEVPTEIELADLAEHRFNALVEAAAELYLSESAEGTLAVFTLVDSPLELGEDALHSISALVEALSDLEFGVRIRIGDELFVGYAMNVRNTAVSEYENFPFNSMAVIGGVPYGAGPDGIYRLQGDDDDGAPIDARVRTAALTFGHLARVPYARIVFTSDGDLLFKTITMDKGARKENTYKMAKRPLGTAVESRFTMAKGVTGSVWAFELSNVDGAYFEADALQVWTLQLDRRYSGR